MSKQKEAIARRRAALDAVKARKLECAEPRPGVHLVIRQALRVFDYWPGTDRWRERDTTLRPGSLSVHRTSRRAGVTLDAMLSHLDGWSSP